LRIPNPESRIPAAREFDLIERIRRRVASRADVVLGIGDDAALLAPPAGQLLVAAQDTLNIGVHFPPDTAPADIGWKALAVNLSDLAAMGAEPAWCLLSLSLPLADSDWIDGFLDGFCALADTHEVALVGGDTTRGPLSVSVAIHGFVPPGQALVRGGAQPGDEIWVTGDLGDAAAALAAGAAADARLRARLDRPTPRLAAGFALRGRATACIDISDGLLADLGHVLAASAVGAELEIADLPCSAALARACSGSQRWQFQLAGGDDYELCFTAPAARHSDIAAAMHAAATPATVIGRIVTAPGCRLSAPDGSDWQPPRRGYQHFSEVSE
jgi:thiamine-monophosphate kinase